MTHGSSSAEQDASSAQSFLIEASERLAAARSMSEVVDVLRRTARSAIGAEGIAVVLKDGDLCHYVAEDAIGPLWRGYRFPADSCVSGWTMRHGQTIAIADILTDHRVPQEAYRPTFVRSLVMAPIGRPAPVAALGAYWSQPGAHDRATIDRLESLARLSGIAIENARLIHEMEESERHRALILAAGRMGSWTFDTATGALDASSLCRRNFGRDPALPFSYADWQAAIHPEDRDRVNAAIRDSLNSGCDYDVEYRVVTPDGGIRWVAVRAQPARLADGAATGLAGISIDITDRKHMEDALRTSAATLEHLVEERTRELVRTQDALRQSQKLEAMGQLTGGVAHDFNNLLTPIIGSLDLLHRRQVGGEREQRVIAGALDSADRARTLVQRLLAFARRQPLKPEPVDLGSLVRGMAELIGTTLGPQIKVRLDLATDLPSALADAHQVEMALLNLAVNARDAMPRGGEFVLSADYIDQPDAVANSVKPGRYVILRVADTGVGMNAETRRRAIEPFFSTKGVGQGTGLGLSMAHGLALQLGGALTIDSAPGHGTAVALWLPVSERNPIEARDAPTWQTAFTGTALLVDDEDIVRASTADMLTDLGFQVMEARSGAEAIACLNRADSIDIMVTDHIMPNMTGVELAREIALIDPMLPVLIVSGYSDAVGLASSLPRLGKPFRQADLAAVLATILPTPLTPPMDIAQDQRQD
ncbi:PAS domain-containing sensor histidine kinase [Sphingobium sp. Z007]|nr:PAS domain-containing sensor histidine kinase [Sphingobium sp. Z007]